MKLRHDMLTHGVNVVTAAHGGRYGGFACAWATQLGTARVLICAGEQSTTREMILASGSFGLNVLAADQVELARAFGSRSSSSVDKLEGVPYHVADTGAPLLNDCVIALDCRVETVHDHGHIAIVVGKVVAAESRRDEAERLVYREEDY